MLRTEQNRTELANCAFAKTVLMLIIVFYHVLLEINSSFVSDTNGEADAVITKFASWLSTFHNYAFVLISGYIYYYIKYENDRYKQFWTFVKKKANRLIVPYFFVLVIWVIPLSCYICDYNIKSSVFIDKFILGTMPSQLWFLLMLFWVFVFFFVISDYLKEHTFIGVIIVTFLHFVGEMATRLVPNIYGVFNGLSFMIFFYIGFLFRQYSLMSRIKKIHIISLLISDIILFALYDLFMDEENIVIKFVHRFGIQLFVSVVGCVLAFILLQMIADKLEFSNNRIFKYCEKRSMGVYLFHQQIVHLCFYSLASSINAYLLIPISFIISFFASALIHDLLYSFQAGRFLIGEK